LESDWAVFFSAVPVLVRVMATFPITAPVESVTVPTIEPKNVCAASGVKTSAKRARQVSATN
jgi:hypothetical protein